MTVLVLVLVGVILALGNALRNERRARLDDAVKLAEIMERRARSHSNTGGQA